MNAKQRAAAEQAQQMMYAIGGGIVGVVVFFVLLLFGPFDGAMRIIGSIGIGGIAGGMVFFMPKLKEGSRGDRIDEALPFFITHFGVLATTDMPRNEMLRILAENEEYKEIAKEMGRIHRLTTEWGLSMVDAVRAVAANTPSPVFSEFLLRLAHAVESGQSIESFLKSEQKVVMEQYSAIYQAQLLKVDSWKEMYANTVMTIGFLAVFAAIIPIISGGNVVLLMTGVALIAVILEVLMGIMLKERLPVDKLMPNRDIDTAEERRIALATMAAIAVAALLAFVGYLIHSLAVGFMLSVIPLLVPGILASRSEKNIRQREEDFPAFIRSLGAAAAARGGGIRDVMEHVQTNKLGALTESVQALYRRLSWHIDDARAWSRFGAQTGSRLVDSFTDMFVHGIRSGGKPGTISQIISDNMISIMGLRTNRRATAGAFRGVLLGLAGGMSLVLFVGAGIFSSLIGLFGDSADILAEQGLLELDPHQDTSLISPLLFIVIAVHAVASAMFFKQVEGGRVSASMTWMAIHMWLGIGIGMLVEENLPNLVGA